MKIQIKHSHKADLSESELRLERLVPDLLVLMESGESDTGRRVVSRLSLCQVLEHGLEEELQLAQTIEGQHQVRVELQSVRATLLELHHQRIEAGVPLPASR